MREKLKVHDGDTPGKVIEVKLEYPKPKVATNGGGKMNNDMKCPVCNVGYVHESVNHWCCDYEFCPSYDETDTETYDILIRTRKALEIASDCMKIMYDNLPDGNRWKWEIEKTLEQIKITMQNWLVQIME